MIYLINISLILLGFLVLYFLLKRKIEKSVNPRALVDEIQVEVDKIIVGLNSTTDRNISLIEEKVSELTEILAKADKKIMLLQRESEKYSVSKNYNHILSQSGKKDLPEKKPADDNDLKQKVLKLYREGFSPSVIANHTNIPVGEVELIISLRER